MTRDDAPDPVAATGPAPDRALRDGLALALAVGVVGVVFGVLARSSGLSVAKACAMSLLVFTGASQIAAAGIVGSGGSSAAALGSALLLAARNTLYGPVIAPWFSSWRTGSRVGLAHLVIDESTGMGAAQTTDEQRRTGFLAAGLGIYVAWNLGTLLGAVAGDLVGDLERFGLDAAFPAVYVAMLAPHLGTTPGRVSALIAGAIAVATVPVLPVGVPILVSTLGAVAGAVVAYREREPA